MLAFDPHISNYTKQNFVKYATCLVIIEEH